MMINDERPRGLKLLMMLHCVTALLALGGMIGAFWLVYPKIQLLEGLDYAVALMVFVMVIWWLVLKVVLSTISTLGMLMAKEWGRQIGIVHAALTLLFVPIGIVVGAVVIFYLTRPKIREYFKPSASG
jgi:uncharacterized membrane protein YgaE (UPF0421/DUF939 family)